MVKIAKIKLDFDPSSFLERSLLEILSSPQKVIIPYATGLKILRVLHRNDNLVAELIRRYKEKQLENGGVVDQENKASIMETIFSLILSLDMDTMHERHRFGELAHFF